MILFHFVESAISINFFFNYVSAMDAVPLVGGGGVA